MAGAGFKTYNTGDVLTASDVNTYLMQQTVMVFADSSARSTALGANVAEGMLSYLEDTDAVEKYDGSSWVAVGGGGSPLTTKGDLYTYSTADTRLAVGSNGTVLTADSAEATGLKWATPTSGSLTSIASGSLSGTEVSITSIPGTYKSLRLDVIGYQPSSSNELYLRVNNNSSAVYAGKNASGTGYAMGNNGIIASRPQNSTTSNFFGTYFFPNYTDTVSWKNGSCYNVTNNQTTSSLVNFDEEYWQASITAAITSIQIRIDGTKTFSAGTYVLYGVN